MKSKWLEDWVKGSVPKVPPKMRNIMGSHDQCHFHHIICIGTSMLIVCAGWWELLQNFMTLLTLLDISFPPQLVSLSTMCDLENSQSVHIIIQYEKFNICKQKLRIMNVLVNGLWPRSRRQHSLECGLVWILDHLWSEGWGNGGCVHCAAGLLLQVIVLSCWVFHE
jgi:hypothetical protein